jgi:polar amino acid transport system substrate-binding protein
MKRFRAILCALAAALILPFGALADNFTLVADSYCPYNCDPEASWPGFSVEIADSVFKKAGHTIDYKLTGWEDAAKETFEGKHTGIIGVTKFDEEFVYPENEVGLIVTKFWIPKDSTWSYKSVDNFKSVVMAVVEGYE